MTRTTKADLVMRVGEACYGAYAVDRLADALPMAKRTVERIAKAAREGDEAPAAFAAVNELERLIGLKRLELDALEAEAAEAYSSLRPDRGVD